MGPGHLHCCCSCFLPLLLLRHKMLWVSLGAYTAWMCRGVKTQWGQTFTNGRQGPTDTSFPLPSSSRRSWVAVVCVASWKVETKTSSVQWLLWERTLVLTLPPPFPAFLLLLPGTILLNKVLAHKPLPQVLFFWEPRLTHIV